jgi:hypothetical protein
MILKRTIGALVVLAFVQVHIIGCSRFENSSISRVADYLRAGESDDQNSETMFNEDSDGLLDLPDNDGEDFSTNSDISRKNTEGDVSSDGNNADTAQQSVDNSSVEKFETWGSAPDSVEYSVGDEVTFESDGSVFRGTVVKVLDNYNGFDKFTVLENVARISEAQNSAQGGESPSSDSQPLTTEAANVLSDSLSRSGSASGDNRSLPSVFPKQEVLMTQSPIYTTQEFANRIQSEFNRVHDIVSKAEEKGTSEHASLNNALQHAARTHNNSTKDLLDLLAKQTTALGAGTASTKPFNRSPSSEKFDELQSYVDFASTVVSESDKETVDLAQKTLQHARARASAGDLIGAEKRSNTVAALVDAALNSNKPSKNGVNGVAYNETNSRHAAYQTSLSLFDSANTLDENSLFGIADSIRSAAANVLNFALDIARFSVFADIPLSGMELFAGKTVEFNSSTGAVEVRDASTLERTFAAGSIFGSVLGGFVAGPAGIAAATMLVGGIEKTLAKNLAKGHGIEIANRAAKEIVDAGRRIADSAGKYGIKTPKGMRVFGKLSAAIETLPGKLKVQRIKEGADSTKIAIVGRSMGDAEKGLVGVKDAATHLKTKGVNPTIYQSSDAAWKDFMKNHVEPYRISVDNPSAMLPENLVKQTDLYKENLAWANKLKDDGYTVLDIGNPNNLDELSPFYEMEKSILFP